MAEARARPSPLDVALAVGMAVLAGATDVYGLAVLHDLFVSFMSGNTTLLGRAIAGGEVARADTIALLVGCFTAGAAAGSVLDVLGGGWRTPLVTGAVCLALAAAAFLPGTEAWALAGGMGMLNGAMTRLGGAAISLTYVTGTLVKFGQGLGRALCGRPDGWSFLWQLPMWLSLLAGAVLGTLLQRGLGQQLPWPLPALAAFLTLLALLRGRSNGAD